MNDQLLTKLVQRLDAPLPRYLLWQSYLEGRQPISFLSPEAKTALGDRLSQLSINIPRLLVEAVAERLRITGFTGVDVWGDWLAGDLDQQAPVLHREALAYGDAYAIVWADDRGRPVCSVESAQQVTTLHDPATRQITAAAKRYETDHTTELYVYLPDRVEHYRADTTGATVGGFKLVDGDTVTNPLGVVPVVRFRNGHRITADHGWSEMSDVLSLTDALVKLTADLMVSSEYAARPRRWATGLELEEDENGDAINPVGENDRMMVNESPEGKFGQLPGSDLSGYQTAIQTIMKQISAVSGLPDHLLGLAGDNPPSADGIRAAEAALTARAEARQQSFGRSWEQVARLMVAVRDGVDVAGLAPRVHWADAATRSIAQESDAVVKLVQAGILPVSYALARLGYSDDEIGQIRQSRRGDALDSAGVDLRDLAS